MSLVTIGRGYAFHSETNFILRAGRFFSGVRPGGQAFQRELFGAGHLLMVESRFFQGGDGMRKVVMGALALAALAGCAGSKMNEARSGTPYKTLASDKAPLVVAECIQFGWQDEGVFGVDAGGFKEPDGAGGFTVYTTGGDYFVDVKSTGTGATIHYYAAQDMMPAKRRLAALATCL